MPAGEADQRGTRRLRSGALGIAFAVAAASVVGLGGTANAVPLPPPNPSDQQIQASENQAAASAAEVGKLSAVVSSTQAKIQQLRNAMELKAELAMKARVDLQVAESEADDAEQAADQAQQAADAAADVIDDAQQQAATFAAASFRQGSLVGSLTALLSSDSMDELLSRSQMIEQVSGNQAAVLTDLETARTNKANLDSQARQALQDAKKAEQHAADLKKAADQAQRDAAQTFAEGKDQLDALQTKLTQQQAEYQAALNTVAELKGQRVQYQAWQKAKKQEEQRLAKQAALQKEQAQLALRQRQLAAKHEDAANKARVAAIRKEKKRQEELRKAQQNNKSPQQNNKSPQQDSGGSAPSNRSVGQQVVQAALAWLGTPYAWGGGNANGPTKGIRDYGIADYYGDYKKIGFDCSGLALYAWAQVGVYLPHYSGYQYNYGKHISRSNLQPGDLVFYAYDTSNPNTIHHVAIYMGNNKMIQAPQSGDVVKISPMRWSGYIGATRPGT